MSDEIQPVLRNRFTPWGWLLGRTDDGVFVFEGSPQQLKDALFTEAKRQERDHGAQ